VFLSNRGLMFPAMVWEPAHTAAALAFIAGIVLTWLYGRQARAKQMADGQPRKIWPAAVALMIGLPLLTWQMMGGPFTVDWPSLRGFNFQGGLSVSPEFAALLIGLVTYTAGFIAEVVRAGILSVNSGQWEAAQALGLRHGSVLRLIVMPQALRVIIPPMTSNYLNLTKNSSLRSPSATRTSCPSPTPP
jgi:general L-amino acid transport system permease protein